MSDSPTSIERSVTIAASAETVWSLISEPGWWVNSGVLTPHDIVDEGNGMCTVRDPTVGAFKIETVALEPPGYAAFRWHPTGPDEASTLTEFWIAEAADGVELRVRESEFDALPAAKIDTFLTDNSEGWEQELALAKAAAETR